MSNTDDMPLRGSVGTDLQTLPFSEAPSADPSLPLSLPMDANALDDALQAVVLATSNAGTATAAAEEIVAAVVPGN